MIAQSDAGQGHGDYMRLDYFVLGCAAVSGPAGVMSDETTPAAIRAKTQPIASKVSVGCAAGGGGP